MLNRAAALFERLEDVDVDWLLSSALENHVPRGVALITAGQPVGALHVVQKGLLGVFSPDGEERIAVVGPGGVVGEMSLLEERAPTESVVAVEPTAVITIPHAVLEARFDRDPQFAARFFRGMAKSLSQRLRRTNGQLALQLRSAPEGGETALRVAAAVDEVTGAVHAAHEAARANRDELPAADADALRDAFLRFYPQLEAAIGAGADEPEHLKEEIGLRVQKELLPYVLLTRNAERAYAKPRGYPGDFMTLEMIYQNVPRGSSRVGPALDRAWLDSPYCAAVRSRRTLLAGEIARALEGGDGEVRVAGLGCGPAGEAFDALKPGGAAARLRMTLVDFDPQALAFVADRRERDTLGRAVRTVEEDLMHLAAGRTRTEVAGQDLAYTVGLLDGMSDEEAVRLLGLLHAVLRPGGRAVVASLLPANPCRAYMEHVLEWPARHRDRAAVDALFAASPFGGPAAEAREDGEGLVLVACRTKE